MSKSETLEKVVKIKEKDSKSIPKKEMKEDINMNRKTLCSAKKIIFITLLIIVILGLFFFASLLLVSQNSYKKKSPVNDPSTNVHQLSEKQKKIAPVVQSGYDIFDINNTFEKKVLLITNYLSKNANFQNTISSDVLYNILLQLKTVKLTVLDAFDPTLDNKDIRYLKSFNLVVIDLLDAGYNLAGRCPNFVKALIQYVKEGGALFSGHDQFDHTHKVYITQVAIDMLKLLGFTHENSWGVGGGSTAYFELSEIGNSIFLVNHALYGESIPIAYTHQTYSKYDNSCAYCRVILKFSKNGSNEYEYLVTNRPNGIGKTVNVRSGHTSGFTEAEKKIFLNSILWLLYDI